MVTMLLGKVKILDQKDQVSLSLLLSISIFLFVFLSGHIPLSLLEELTFYSNAIISDQ